MLATATRPLILAKDLISVTSADRVYTVAQLGVAHGRPLAEVGAVAGLGAVDELLGSVTHLVHQYAAVQNQIQLSSTNIFL
jgi:fructose 1,6-bisphosphatase